MAVKPPLGSLTAKNNSAISFTVKPSRYDNFHRLEAKLSFGQSARQSKKAEIGSLNKYLPYFIFLDFPKALAV